MKEAPVHAEYHPKWHRTRMSPYWWLWKWPYLKFMAREISSVFVAWGVLLMLLEVRALGAGPAAVAEFNRWLGSPLLIALNAVSVVFVLFHTVTWFNLTPKAMVVRVGGKRVPDLLIAGPNYIVWLAVSALLAWILRGGGP